jgi:WD40 repeat protein
VQALAVAPDGGWLASSGADPFRRKSGEVRIWDVRTGADLHTIAGHDGAAKALAIAPDGSWLAFAVSDGEVRIWEPGTGKTRHSLAGHIGRVLDLEVAPDGSWLACGRSDVFDRTDGDVRVWDPHTGRALTPSRAIAAECRSWRSLRTAPGSCPPVGTVNSASGIRVPDESGTT